MFIAIFTFISTLIGAIFRFVSQILSYVCSLPLWFIAATNAIGTLGIVAIIYLIIPKKIKK